MLSIKLTDSLPRYNLPLLLSPMSPHPHHSPVHRFNFVANGHPYKITVNNKVIYMLYQKSHNDFGNSEKMGHPVDG